MVAMCNQFQNSHAENQSGGASSSKNKSVKGHNTWSDSNLAFPKLAKLVFPRYNGFEDPTN